MTSLRLPDSFYFKGVVLGVIFFYVSMVLLFVLNNSHFVADDFDHFHQAAVMGLFEMMSERIDVHYVPLHKLFSYLIYHISPLNFDLALAAMLVQWLAVIYLLYKVQRFFIPANQAVFLLALLASSPVWLHTLIWWSAAAHRLPFFIIQAAVFLYYLNNRSRETKYLFVVVALLQLVALGFYVKAVLIPCVLVAIEICIYSSTKKLSRAGVKACIASIIVSVTYIFWYFYSTDSFQEVAPFLFSESMLVILISLQQMVALYLLLPVQNFYFQLVVSLLVLMAVGWSVWRRPNSVVPIVMLVGLLFANTLVTVIGRGGMLVFATGSMRYFCESIVIIGLFLAIIISHHLRPGLDGAKAVKNIFLSFLGVLLVVVYSTSSYFYNKNFFEDYYSDYVSAHSYLSRLIPVLKDKSENETGAKIVDSNLPLFVYGYSGIARSISSVFSSVYPHVDFVEKDQAPLDAYYVKADGSLFREASDLIDFKNDANFSGWSVAEDHHRWSLGNQATVMFGYDAAKQYKGLVTIRGPILDSQRVTVFINDNLVAKKTLNADSNCCTWQVEFSPELLSNEINKITFVLPDAHQPSNGDTRVLAIGVSEMLIQ